MAKRYNVRVREDYRWGKARVSGREFHKSGEVLSEQLINDEMQASPLLEIEPIEAEEELAEIDATGAAQELAEEEGVDLADIEGSGLDGRILVSDVRDAIGGE